MMHANMMRTTQIVSETFLIETFSAGHNIDWFECNSVNDRRCGDPFNYTLTIEDMPPLAKCQGCCVKLVQNVGTDYKSVRLIVFIYHWNWFYLNNLEKVEATNLLNRPLETFNICFCRRTCTDRIDINLWLVHHGEDFTEKKNISKIQYFRLHEWGRGTRSPVFLWRRWLQLCSNNIQCHHLLTHFAFNIVQCYFVICDLKHFLYSSIFPEHENKHNLLYLSNLMVQKTNILD